MTGLERNSDVVVMASYAPLLAREGMQQWTPDMIWFNAREVLLTPNYHVQAMFAATVGDQVVQSCYEGGNDRVYHVVTRTEDKLYVKLVNVSADESVLDAEGKVDVRKLQPITYDSMHHRYLALGEAVGQAFHDGLALK